MSTAPQARGERGQVLSSVVAVAAVVAVVIGLLVLFGTGGPGGSDDNGSGGTPSSSAASTPPVLPSSTPPSTSTPVSTPPTRPPATTVSAPQPTRTVTRTAVPPATTKPALGPRPSVEIYNNTSERGLAERTSRRAESAGWTVAGIDNWIGKVATTSVYYPLGMHGHATRLASDLGIGRVKPALSNMKTDRLTVILTTDYSG